MTNQNPASNNPPSGKFSQEILSKVNAHADRLIDPLFADIDELLSGDLSGEIPPPVELQQPHRYSPESIRISQTSSTEAPSTPYQQYQPQSNFTPPEPPIEPKYQKQSKPKQQKQGIPLWMKAFLGIGVVSIALSSLLLWLTNEKKIDIAKNIDTSWLPFQSKSQISPDDAKFAEYMRKSIAKIEAGNIQSNSAVVAPTTTTPAFSNPGTVVSAIPPANVNTAKTAIALIKTLPKGERLGAIFELNNQAQTVYVGGKIGTSEWSLVTIAKGEAIVKKPGGVIRSIYVGQKF